MIKKLMAFIALLVLSSAVKASENKDCYTTFYQTKNMECVDGLLDTVNKSAEIWTKQPTSMPSAFIGFIAEIFRDYPKEREHILKQNSSTDVKSIYFVALFRAGLIEDARKYAEKMGFMVGFEKYQSMGVPTLKEVKPSSNPADNDLLIGAYMASGNTDYISAVLDNYEGVDDGMANDAFRIAQMESKFGARLTPPGRENIMAPALCKKYECKTNIKDFMHTMTLASAFWAVKSLAQHDDGAKKALVEFFDENKHLKQLLANEQTAFGNYVTMLAAYAGIKGNPNINSSLATYEGLGSGENALNAIGNSAGTSASHVNDQCESAAGKSCPKVYTGPDGVTENFGAREAPYEGFLMLPKEKVPEGYVERDHHYTKAEYALNLTKTINSKSFLIQIFESRSAMIMEPKQPVVMKFNYKGQQVRVYEDADHSGFNLYWLNAPMQRLSISVEQLPTKEWSPDALVALFKDMVPADGVPALITPFPKPVSGFP